MTKEVESRRVRGAVSVLDQAQPDDPHHLRLAQRLTDRIAELINGLVLEAESGIESEDRWRKQAVTLSDDGFSVNSMFDKARPWLQSRNRSTEREMYAWISAFVLLAAHLIRRISADEDINAILPRLILPFSGTDKTPVGSDSDKRVDVALTCCNTDSPIAPQPDIDYGDVFAIAEVKAKFTDASFDDALAQLFDYTRQVYYNQIDRRFAWGLTCCGAVVNACQFNNYKVRISPDMDMTSRDGRAEFIRLLVGWSLCERRRLGYDETITWLDDLNCYEIEVPSGTVPGDHVSYYSSSFIRGADRLFGRHCRCLLATHIRPMEPVSATSPIEPTVVVKDSWTIYSLTMEMPPATETVTAADTPDVDIAVDMSRLQVQADSASCLWPSADTLRNLDHVSNLRSEHAMLRTINSMLADDRDLDGTYPVSTDGGWVYQPSGNGPVLDCTLEIAGDLDAKEQSTTPFCLHGRHTLAPIGMPLRTVTSAPELITILYDAMRAHSAISERCRILHRDISENNILAVQRDDGSIHGVLMDFDCAVDVSAQRVAARPERTGTLSFMSSANLKRFQLSTLSLIIESCCFI
ncbi:hypothetical protein H4R20_001660 [Coemansia guatemalensis]|uniref:Fungal-type protein kinase domain-containing protein n=1 Tax=Coemansia guatemalensis TaxID=2761395 RepID=A0A9W8LVS6_9FUNG|nr:hypothetical protein H4R20_001660 [Coemansia guatemalensis]